MRTGPVPRRHVAPCSRQPHTSLISVISSPGDVQTYLVPLFPRCDVSTAKTTLIVTVISPYSLSITPPCRQAYLTRSLIRRLVTHFSDSNEKKTYVVLHNRIPGPSNTAFLVLHYVPCVGPEISGPAFFISAFSAPPSCVGIERLRRGMRYSPLPTNGADAVCTVTGLYKLY